jgi:catechol 2,3-dioxygenase-like lactoylglutathione lyase family enzyme
MLPDREHPLYYLDAETLLVAIYVWVDDELKALQAQGFKLSRKQRHQKATLAELLTLAIFLLLQGQDLAKGYLAAKTTLKAYFPSLPHLSRFYRILQKAPELLAHLAVRLSAGKGLLQVVDLKPIPLAHGHRVHGLNLPEAAVGVGPLGAFGGYVLMPVMNERSLFFRSALLPGNAGRLGEGSFWRTSPGIPLGPGGQDPTLSGSWGEGGGDGVERVDGEGAQLDRNAVQRDGAVFRASSDRGAVLLGLARPGQPHPARSQSHT